MNGTNQDSGLKKVLIGTPVHEVKDYCMKQWLENISQSDYPADLLMVDNSSGTRYLEKIRGYCEKYGLQEVEQFGKFPNKNSPPNYKLLHLELPAEQKVHQRVAQARELIRKEILDSDYHLWFTWECDQIIPNNALQEMIRIMDSGDFMMVNHDGRGRENNDLSNTDFGVSLIKRQCLEKYGFILEFGTDPDMPSNWSTGEEWFKKRVVRGGGNSIDVYGVIQPIYHLNN